MTTTFHEHHPRFVNNTRLRSGVSSTHGEDRQGNASMAACFAAYDFSDPPVQLVPFVRHDYPGALLVS